MAKVKGVWGRCPACGAMSYIAADRLLPPCFSQEPCDACVDALRRSTFASAQLPFKVVPACVDWPGPEYQMLKQ